MKMIIKLFVIDPKVDDLTVYKWLRYNKYVMYRLY